MLIIWSYFLRLMALLGLIILPTIAISSPESKELKIGYAEACPHMCPDGENKGFTVEITKAALERYGWQLQFIPLPWARAVSQTNAGALNAVISTGKQESPFLIYPEMELATQKDCFYGLNTDTWKPQSPDSFAERKTIIFKGWVLEKKYKQYFGDLKYKEYFEEFSIDEHYIPHSIKLVKRNRMSSFWCDETVYNYFRATHSPKITKNIRKLGCVHQQKLYIGFSPQYPELAKQLSRDFDRGMRRLRSSGELDTILSKYGLTDWVQ